MGDAGCNGKDARGAEGQTGGTDDAQELYDTCQSLRRRCLLMRWLLARTPARISVDQGLV